MLLHVDDAWLMRMAKAEEGCDVSAGSEMGSRRSFEIECAKKNAAEVKKPFAVFFQDEEFGHMRWSDWLKVVKHGVAEQGGYDLVAKVTSSGRVRLIRGGAVIVKGGA